MGGRLVSPRAQQRQCLHLGLELGHRPGDQLGRQSGSEGVGGGGGGGPVQAFDSGVQLGQLAGVGSPARASSR